MSESNTEISAVADSQEIATVTDIIEDFSVSPYLEETNESSEEVKETNESSEDVKETSKSDSYARSAARPKTHSAVEQFYTDEETQQLKRIFADRKKHLRYLFKLYKFIIPITTPRKKQLYEKTEEDVVRDISNTVGYSLNMDSLANDISRDIAESIRSTELFHKQIACIPVFIDFSYIYYIRHFCDDSPVLKLPTFLPKFRMIMAAIKAPDNELHACFEQCIQNTIIADMRQEIPPYHLRTDLTEEEIREKVKLLILPMFKDILKYLLTLGTMKKIPVRVGNDGTSGVPIARADNLDEPSSVVLDAMD